MNDRTGGALEALAYIRSKTKDRKTLKEIRDCIDELLSGAAIDWKIRNS